MLPIWGRSHALPTPLAALLSKLSLHLHVPQHMQQEGASQPERPLAAAAAVGAVGVGAGAKPLAHKRLQQQSQQSQPGAAEAGQACPYVQLLASLAEGCYAYLLPALLRVRNAGDSNAGAAHSTLASLLACLELFLSVPGECATLAQWLVGCV